MFHQFVFGAKEAQELMVLLQRGIHSSGVYICKSIVNDFRHGNYICTFFRVTNETYLKQ